jgi:uncharacterized protein
MSDVIDNRAERRFEVTEDGHTGTLTYEVDGDRITLIHTGVPKELEGRGLAGRLVQAAVDRATSDGLTIAPWCPYARRWLRKHEAEVGAPVDWSAARPE